jgi:hypothetical protein
MDWVKTAKVKIKNYFETVSPDILKKDLEKINYEYYRDIQTPKLDNDLTNLLKGYEDKWVIISKDYKEILKSSDNAEEIINCSNLGIIMLVPNPKFINS